MCSWFRRLGRSVRGKLTTAKWAFYEFTGTEEEACRAEEEAGRDIARQLAKTYPLFRNQSYREYLDAMGRCLGDFIGPSRYRFTYSPVSSLSVNAFALPGGAIFVTRGLLKFTKWERVEIAFAVSHEIGHVVRHHARDRMMAIALNKGIGLLARRAHIHQAIASLADAYVFSEYSHDCEFEADRFAAQLLAKAHMNPSAGCSFLRRLDGIAEHHGPVTAERFFTSHPPIAERILNIERATTRASSP